MAIITNRDEFKEYVLRKLGAPILEINVTDEQIEDRIDDALKYFWDYHFDGQERVYYKHQITQEDKDRKWIEIPQNILGAVRIFDIGVGATTGGMFSIQYQLMLNDMFTFTSQSLIPYFLAMYNLQQIELLLNGKKAIRYNRHRNQLFIDINWDMFEVGHYVIVEAFQLVDPEEFTDVWNDRWLQSYTTTLVKLQWGENLTKFVGGTLPGGVMFNGDRILSDAQNEKAEKEAEMLSAFSTMPLDMIG